MLDLKLATGPLLAQGARYFRRKHQLSQENSGSREGEAEKPELETPARLDLIDKRDPHAQSRGGQTACRLLCTWHLHETLIAKTILVSYLVEVFDTE